MTAHPFLKVDKDTFYRFVAAAPEGRRYEYVNGRIVQHMTGGTVEHSTISRRFSTNIERQLDPDRWLVSSGSDRGVETSVTIRYPDVIVEPSPPPRKSLATQQAAVIVEVLSEYSGERDLEIKPSEYLGLSTLAAYVVASQDEPVCQVWIRGVDGKFPANPATIEGRDQVIHIPALSVAIPLAQVYRGIGS